MLRFFNRQLEPISQSEWQKLLRDPAYVLLGKKVFPHALVDCTWVGVAPEYEAQPEIFLVRLLILQKKPRGHQGKVEPGDMVVKEEYSKWLSSESQALEAYFKALTNAP